MITAVGDDVGVHSASPADGLGPRTVSVIGVIGQSLAIGPIFSVGFLSGGVAVYAGFDTPLAVALAAMGAIALAYVLSLYGRRFAGPGVVYEYLALGVSRSVGVIGAGAYVLGLLFLGGGAAFVAEGYLVDRLLAGELSIRVNWWPWALLALVVAMAINHRGVKIGIQVIVGTALVSAIPFLVTAGAIIASGGAAGNSLAVFDPGQTSWTAVFHGVLFAILLFVGFETVAALGDEAVRPRRSIPLTMIVAIVLAGSFYLVVVYAGAIGFGRAAASSVWFSSGNPFGDLGRRYVAHPFGWIINLTIVLDLFSVCVALTLATARVLLALARDGLLPRALMRTSVRFHTPTAGLAVIATWSSAAIAWSALTRYGDAVHRPDALEAALILTAAGTYLVTLVYLMLSLGGLVALRRFRSGAVRPWQVPLVLVAIAAPVLSFDGSLDPFPHYPANLGLVLAAASLSIVIAWGGALRTWRPELVRRAAARGEAAAQAAPAER